MNRRLIVQIAAVAMITAFTLASITAVGQETKASSKMTEAKQLKTVKEAQSVEAGDVVVMCCPKCKTVTYAVAEPDKAGEAASKPWLKNAKGKKPQEALAATCEECGTETFCCVIKKKDLAPGRSQ